METQKFTRKPFEVDAVQVTAENMKEVANWCQGEIKGNDSGDGRYIKVRVLRVMSEKQTQAYVGDWVLYAGTGYKVYTAKAFKNSFEPLDGVAKDAAVQASKLQDVEELRTTTSVADEQAAFAAQQST